MQRQLGIVMDPIDRIHVHKDSSFAMLLAAQARGWSLIYMEQQDLYWQSGEAMARLRPLHVRADPHQWFELGEAVDCPLHSLPVILMRKDPPFDLEYIYTTYLLEHAERQGSWVINRPQSLRDANEKLFTTWFPACCPPTLVTRDKNRIAAFRAMHSEIILKPLDGMGGASVFRVGATDPNFSVIVETLTQQGRQTIMAQRYLPEIAEGDKRILLINGEPIPYALARIPAAGEARGNLAAGGTGRPQPLSDRDRWICAQVGPALREKGLWFVGLDVIGDYLTEINVTSPTCIRELDKAYNLNIGDTFLQFIEGQLA